MKASLIFTGSLTNVKGDVYNGTHYLEPCYEQIIKHITSPNKDWEIDSYFHMWSDGTAEENNIIEKILKLYKPIKAEFTSGLIKNNFISKMKSNWKAFNLIEKKYDLYIFLRPDIYFNKTLNLSEYNLEDIYHNNGMIEEGGHFGDFYFIMNEENAKEYVQIYIENKKLENEIWSEDKWRHIYIPKIENKLNKLGKIKDDLKAGSRQEVEVYRKRRKGYKGLIASLKNKIMKYK